MKTFFRFSFYLTLTFVLREAKAGGIIPLMFFPLPSIYTWTGMAGDNNWNTPANWNRNAVPGSYHIAMFRGGACAGVNCNATVNTAVNVKAIRMDSSYTGIITQAAGMTITVGAAGWIQSGGTFVGGNSTITTNGAFTLNGGVFTSTSGNFTVYSDFTISGSPTFSAGGGLFTFNNSQSMTTGNAIFNNVTFGGIGAHSLNAGTMTIAGNLTLNDSAPCCGTGINSGTILLSGNLNIANFGAPGTVNIKLVGTTNQTITGNGTGVVPSLEIASTGGTVTLTNIIKLSRDFKHTSGVVDASTSELVFYNSSTIVPGTIAYHDVTFSGAISSDNLSGGTMSVYGTLTLSETAACCGSDLNSGTILLYGNLTLANYGKAGSATIRLVGGTNQLIAGSSTARVPSLEIASTGGTVTITGSIEVVKNFTYTSGLVDASTSSFLFIHTQTITPGTMVFNSVTFGNTLPQDLNGGTMTTTGTVTLNDSADCCGGVLNNGTLVIKGNLDVTAFGKHGTANVQFAGSSAQTVSQVAGAAMPTGTWVVNKTGGSITQLTDFSLTGANPLTVTAGNWGMAGFNLTVSNNLTLNGNTITKGGGILTVLGSTVGTGALLGGTVAP